MEQMVDVIFRVGQFAMLVVAACVAVMLLVSFIDSHPRDKGSRDDRDSTD